LWRRGEEGGGGAFTAAASVSAFFACVEPPAAELLTVLPHDRGRRLQPNADTAALIDKSALGRYPPNDIFRSQYPRHFAATLTRIFASNAICGVKLL
jgi:hypothetical protein